MKQSINGWLNHSIDSHTFASKRVQMNCRLRIRTWIALGNAVENEGNATRQQLLDDTNALGKEIETTNKPFASS